jgi:hypothetical protein
MCHVEGEILLLRSRNFEKEKTVCPTMWVALSGNKVMIYSYYSPNLGTGGLEMA